MGKFIDMTGWVMKEHGVLDSRWTVISRAPNKSTRATWNCICECGNTAIVDGTTLRTGKSLSCGCLQQEKTSLSNRKHNFINKRFGRLIVLKATNKRSCGSILYECQCDCGNIVEVVSTSLENGSTTSCGCYRKEISKSINYIDLTNKKFGHLTVLEEEESKNHKIIWKCQCDCENKTIIHVPTSNLTSGNTTSCGCDRRSKGEKLILNILKNNNINYIYQWDNNKKFRYEDTNYPIKFDFYLPDYNSVIEFDGQQHLTGWGNDKESFNYIQVHDNIKNEICKINNIKLIRIPYTDLSKLNYEYLLERLM